MCRASPGTRTSVIWHKPLAMKRPRVRFISHRGRPRVSAGGCSACAIRGLRHAAVGRLRMVPRSVLGGTRREVPQHASLAALHRHMRLTEIRSGEYFMQRVLEVGFAGNATRARGRARLSIRKSELGKASSRTGAASWRPSARRLSALVHHAAPSRVSHRRRRRRFAILPDCIVTIGAQTESLLKEWAPTLAGRITVGASLRTVRQNVPHQHRLRCLSRFRPTATKR